MEEGKVDVSDEPESDNEAINDKKNIDVVDVIVEELREQ